ncbi:alpha/beta fold hydrolase [Pseudooctadecabacter jejudonensis]|uniref:Tropinesterase n=1 Tax=Pseudooctadecabacter jejudonensis TaxID=1391910 RepID=A0A1Y5SPL6_9RHOB|nr:alpha/beta hydrolase [Pseudooctadecabacter jejudonensis]SLN45272.1 Tropinesterase [Pseudooctadecabacter jejudonensis]
MTASSFTTADRTRLHYIDEGPEDHGGLPVLCLAGLTRNSHDFDHVAPQLLATGIRLIRMDYRGRGQSDWADPATYTIPHEAADALALLDHLGLEKTAILGTSRGGLIAMMLAATAKHRLLGVALNDIGPEIAPAGLSVIKDYIGRNPVQYTHEEAAHFRARAWSHFTGVPHTRWLAEVRNHYAQTDTGLVIKYDPRLRDAVLDAGAQPVPDLWPLFDAMAGLPLAMLRGDASDLLTAATFDTMRNRRPDAHAAVVTGRGHVPFLDEPEAISTLKDWITDL